MTHGRVTIDGLRNEPMNADEVAAMIRPLVDAVGLDVGDVASIHIDPRKAVRFKVRVRNRRGRSLPDSWAHVVVKIDDDDYEDGS